MYLGYMQMVLDLVAFGFIVLEIVNYGKSRRHLSRRRGHHEGREDPGHEHQREFKDEEVFSRGQQVGIDLIKAVATGANFAQGWLMVRATKLVVRQISTQELNP